LKTGTFAEEPTLSERVSVCRQHFQSSLKWKGPHLGIFEMRRHYAHYFRGIADFKPYRIRLVMAPTEAEVLEILNEIEEMTPVLV
jgi:tRNA-dihydrouridine synthase